MTSSAVRGFFAAWARGSGASRRTGRRARADEHHRGHSRTLRVEPGSYARKLSAMTARRSAKLYGATGGLPPRLQREGARAAAPAGARARALGARAPAVPPPAASSSRSGRASARRPRSCCATSPTCTSPASSATPTQLAEARRFLRRRAVGEGPLHARARGRVAALVRARDVRLRVPLLDPRARERPRAHPHRGAARARARRRRSSSTRC